MENISIGIYERIKNIIKNNGVKFYSLKDYEQAKNLFSEYKFNCDPKEGDIATTNPKLNKIFILKEKLPKEILELTKFHEVRHYLENLLFMTKKERKKYILSCEKEYEIKPKNTDKIQLYSRSQRQKMRRYPNIFANEAMAYYLEYKFSKENNLGLSLESVENRLHQYKDSAQDIKIFSDIIILDGILSKSEFSNSETANIISYLDRYCWRNFNKDFNDLKDTILNSSEFVKHIKKYKEDGISMKQTICDWCLELNLRPEKEITTNKIKDIYFRSSLGGEDYSGTFFEECSAERIKNETEKDIIDKKIFLKIFDLDDEVKDFFMPIIKIPKDFYEQELKEAEEKQNQSIKEYKERIEDA